jgi:hypothetical protein
MKTDSYVKINAVLRCILVMKMVNVYKTWMIYNLEINYKSICWKLNIITHKKLLKINKIKLFQLIIWLIHKEEKILYNLLFLFLMLFNKIRLDKFSMKKI